MIVPAKEVYVEVESIKVGDKLNISSGMGGSFSVVINKLGRFFIMYSVLNKGWERNGSVLYAEAEDYFFNLEAA